MDLLKCEDTEKSMYGMARLMENTKITWDNLLDQSSDWSGTLFGLHDWADRPPKEGGVMEKQKT
jgi:hypothetical protein